MNCFKGHIRFIRAEKHWTPDRNIINTMLPAFAKTLMTNRTDKNGYTGFKIIINNNFKKIDLDIFVTSPVSVGRFATSLHSGRRECLIHSRAYVIAKVNKG